MRHRARRVVPNLSPRSIRAQGRLLRSRPKTVGVVPATRYPDDNHTARFTFTVSLHLVDPDAVEQVHSALRPDRLVQGEKNRKGRICVLVLGRLRDVLVEPGLARVVLFDLALNVEPGRWEANEDIGRPDRPLR